MEALDNNTDFTVETNFRDPALINTVNLFKEKDYVASIVYIDLSDVRQSMDRVSARVKGGGHFVDTGSIHYNYNEGLKNFEYFADRFDNLEFIDASENLYELRSLLSVQNRQVVFVSNDLPKWVKPIVSSIVKQFNPSLPKRDDDNKYRGGPR